MFNFSFRFAPFVRLPAIPAPMERTRYTFNDSAEQIRLHNPEFRQSLADDQASLAFAVLVIVCVTVLPALISRLFSRRPRVFQIYNNQLNNSSFVPYSYLVKLHLEKGLVSRWRMPNFETKFRFELLNAQKKRTVNFSIPLKFLIIRSCLPSFALNLYRIFHQFIKFFSFLSLNGQHNNEICFLVHRRKVLEQITSVRLDVEICLDVNIYLHGLTVYSLNSNFAYYCA